MPGILWSIRDIRGQKPPLIAAAIKSHHGLSETVEFLPDTDGPILLVWLFGRASTMDGIKYFQYWLRGFVIGFRTVVHTRLLKKVSGTLRHQFFMVLL